MKYMLYDLLFMQSCIKRVFRTIFIRTNYIETSQLILNHILNKCSFKLAIISKLPQKTRIEFVSICCGQRQLNNHMYIYILH